MADAATLRELHRERRVLLRYCDVRGAVNEAANPNGSAENIAGICNAAGNVFGLMPHPERACDARLGSIDGRMIFESVLIQRGVREGCLTARRARLVGEFDGCDGQGGNAFTAADKAKLLIGRRLDADPLRSADPALRPGAAFIASRCGAILRRFSDERGVDIQEASPLRRSRIARRAGRFQTAHAPDGIVGIGEMMADVALADRAENGVGDRVAKHVRIAVPVESVANGGFPRPRGSAGVLPQSDARRSRCRRESGRNGEVKRALKLSVVGATATGYKSRSNSSAGRDDGNFIRDYPPAASS